MVVPATEFEKLGGRGSTRKWRQSLRYQGDDGERGIPVGKWLRRGRQGSPGVVGGHWGRIIYLFIRALNVRVLAREFSSEFRLDFVVLRKNVFLKKLKQLEKKLRGQAAAGVHREGGV